MKCERVFFFQICSFNLLYTAQKMKFSIKDFFSKCNQIRSIRSSLRSIRISLRIWSHLLKKSLMENFIFGAICSPIIYVRIYVLECSCSVCAHFL